MSSHLISSRTTSTLFSQLRQVLANGLFPSIFPTKTLHAPLLSPIHATCPTHLILNSIKSTCQSLLTWIWSYYSHTFIYKISYSWGMDRCQGNCKNQSMHNKACFLPFMTLLLCSKYSFHRQQCYVYLLTTMSMWLLWKSRISTDEV